MSKRVAAINQGVPKIEVRQLGRSIQQQQFQPEDEDFPEKRSVLLSESSESHLSKLDLIFRNQPKQIQQKLLQLLIRYNAMMQYNRVSDMFEVDLLIPFQSEEQKRQFIRQFLEIRRQKKSDNTSNYIGKEVLQNNHFSDEIEWIGGNKEIKKFSFNNGGQEQGLVGKLAESGQNYLINSQLRQNNERDQREQQKKKKAEETINLTGHFNELVTAEKQQQKINFQTLDSVIARRLKNAVDIIQIKKQKFKDSQSSMYQSWPVVAHSEAKEESIIDQIGNSYSLGSTGKMKESKNFNYSGQIKSLNQQEQPLQYKSAQPQDGARKGPEINYISEKIPYHQIAQEPEEQDYEQLFPQNQEIQKKGKDNKVTSFEDYAKKYASIKNQKTTKSKAPQKINYGKRAMTQKQHEKKITNPLAQQYQSSKDGPFSKRVQNNTVNVVIKDRKPLNQGNNSNKIGQTNKKRSSKSQTKKSNSLQQSRRKINAQLDIFFQTYRNSLDKLYSQIRQKIEQKVRFQPKKLATPEKSLDDLYILVLDDLPQSGSLPSISQEAESSVFKEEMVRQYHKQILVNNSSLSSEDLIRYFRFLHSNAKKLYLKYLKNKKQ